MSEGRIVVKKGREKPIRNRHPWVFSGAIQSAENAINGEIVAIYDHKDKFLARAYWNSKSQIQARILTWQDEPINNTWLQKKITQAVKARFSLPDGSTAKRLIHGESDYLPGLIVDRYGDYLVMQALTLFMDIHKTELAEILVNVLAEFNITVQGVYERSDVDVRKREGLFEHKGVLWGENPPERLPILLFGIQHEVDIVGGHKTGFYLDQAMNQRILTNIVGQSSISLSHTPTLLNLFSYTGSFGLGLKHYDINATHVDASMKALEFGEVQHTHAGMSAEWIQADCFEYLRDISAQNQQYDFIVLDPPKFAHNKKQIGRASRGYKDLNLHALNCVKSGGYLMTYSCSGAISRDLFQKIVFGALADSGRDAQIIQHLQAGDDHPIALSFPEGEYLKGLLLRVY